MIRTSFWARHGSRQRSPEPRTAQAEDASSQGRSSSGILHHAGGRRGQGAVAGGGGGAREQTSSGGPRGRPRSVRNLLAPSSAGTSARRADGRMGLRGGGLRRAMRTGQPEPDVGEDLFDHLGLINACDDPHRAATLGAQHGIGLIGLFDQPSPLLLECPGRRGRWGLDHFRQCCF